MQKQKKIQLHLYLAFVSYVGYALEMNRTGSF